MQILVSSDPELGRQQVRFAFCKSDRSLDEASRRLEKLKGLK